MHQRRNARVIDVRVLVLHVELAEGHQLFQLFHERLYDRIARKALLREIRQIRERALTDLPLFHHRLSHEHADQQDQPERDQRKKRQTDVHAPHLDEGENAEKHGVEKHQKTVAEAFLNRVEIVRKEAHQVADLVDLIILAGQVLAMVEHFDADDQMGYIEKSAKFLRSIAE